MRVVDEVALAVAEKAEEYLKPDLTIVGGDMIDAGPFARHAKIKLDEHKGYDLFTSELEPANKLLDRITKRTSRIVYLEGNHDSWLSRWAVNEGGSAGSALFNAVAPKRNLSMGRKNFTWIDNEDYFRLSSRLIAVHGWNAASDSARRHLDQCKPSSIIFHHVHRMQYLAEGVFSEHLPIDAMCAGCLCKKDPLYLHGAPSKWVHGFGVAFVGKHSHTMYPVKVNGNSAVMPDGHEVRV